MKPKKHQVYTHLVWVVGFNERMELPEAIKDVVKSTWHDPYEIFVRFLPN